MRLRLGSTIIIAALLLVCVSAQSVGDLIAAVPQCALRCVLGTVVDRKCPMTNLTALANCVCTDNVLMANMSACVQTSCEFADQVTSGNMLMGTCEDYPKESRVQEITTTAIVTLVLSVSVVTARCIARHQITGRLWSDDWTALLATVLLVAGATLELVSASLGFGLHLWDVYVTRASSLLRIFYVVELLYTWIKLLAKASIVLFYMRVFTARWLQTACYSCLIYYGLSAFVFTLVLVFQCHPIESVWNRYLVGKCLNLNAIGYSGAIRSIVEDLVLVILPIPELRKLQISVRHKIGVACMFAIASFACIASMIRLKYLEGFGKTFDSTYDNVDGIVWSLIELTCIIICGSIPPLRPLIGKFISVNDSKEHRNAIRSRSNNRMGRAGSGFDMINDTS